MCRVRTGEADLAATLQLARRGPPALPGVRRRGVRRSRPGRGTDPVATGAAAELGQAPGPVSAVTGELNDPGVVVTAFDANPEVLVGELLGPPATPLHQGDRLLQARVQIQVVNLGHAAEPVGVRMHHGQLPAPLRIWSMDSRDDEGRRRDATAHSEPLADALSEGRLAGTQWPVEDHEIAGAQHGGHPAPEALGIRGRRQLHPYRGCRHFTNPWMNGSRTALTTSLYSSRATCP